MLPTTVFGDPMQCIFDFAGPMPNWDNEVIPNFPVIAQLSTPWRWVNAQTPDLGFWILACRNSLMKGQSIDLQSCPNHVTWHQLTGDARIDSRNQTAVQYQIQNDAEVNESFLVIGDSRNVRSRHTFASSSRGIDVVEPVELSDITQIASRIDSLTGSDLATYILSSASSMMTGVGRAEILNRMPSIVAGLNRVPPSPVEAAVKNVIETGERESISNLLHELELSTNTRVFRWGAFSAFKSTVSMSASSPTLSFRQAAETVREQRRHQGDRRISQRAIGSTLLLKGLESDHSLVLNAGVMNSHNIYVALSRGAKSVSIFSDTSTIKC